MPQASPCDMVTRSLPPYFAHIVKVRFAHPHLLTILTKYTCLHDSFWGSRCDSSHAPTISLKPVHFHVDFGTSFRLMTQVLSRRTSSLTSDHPHYFKLIRPYFYQIFTICLIPNKTNLFRLATQNTLKTNQNVQILSITLTEMYKEPSFNIKPTKILSVFGGRGLPARSIFTQGCKHTFQF